MLKDKLRRKDIKSSFLFLLALPFAFVKRIFNRNIWLVSERPQEARDNGYWFFKYVRENHPKQKIYYVITKNAADLKKIEQYGNIVYYNTFRHYVIYLASKLHISAHIDSDSPNSRVSNFLETHGLLKNKKIFLQHGITKDKISFGYYSCSRADLFVCAAKPEWEFCRQEFGYPEGSVQLLGFARFDGLDVKEVKRQILLMPTWRAWLANSLEKDFKESEYWKRYISFLKNEELNHFLEREQLQLIFFPHADMQPYLGIFSSENKNIVIANAKNYEVQSLLKESLVLITDYSSVAFDMAYMDKPLCYYHFDYEDYRKGQHPEGYFSYERDGFGPIVQTETDIIKFLEDCAKNEFKLDQEYQLRANSFFTLKDKNNCRRIFDAIKKI